jgi:hypothetical protein
MMIGYLARSESRRYILYSWPGNLNILATDQIMRILQVGMYRNRVFTAPAAVRGTGPGPRLRAARPPQLRGHPGSCFSDQARPDKCHGATAYGGQSRLKFFPRRGFKLAVTPAVARVAAQANLNLSWQPPESGPPA